MVNEDPFTINFDEAKLITRIVELQDELENIGANKLLKEIEELRTALKGSMMKNLKDYVIDEISGHYAEIQVRTKIEYNLEKLKETIGSVKAQRYILEQVDQNAVNRGIKNGDLSQASLEGAGVITRTPTTAALYIRKIEE